MITRYLTNISVKFNPFSPRSKTARVLLSLLPSDARQTMKITSKILPRESVEQSTISVTFKDGKHMDLEAENFTIKDLVEELDRHSRVLRRKEELGGS